MHKYHKRILYIVGLFTLVITYLLKLVYDAALLNSIMTVLSIIMGFNITAVSTLYSRKFIVNLHKKIDIEIPGQTQLQTLKRYFAISSQTTLATIMYLILYQLLIKNCQYILLSLLDVELLCTSLILPLVSLNICVLVFLLKVFLKGLIYEAEDI